jgi:hypothetical protein
MRLRFFAVIVGGLFPFIAAAQTWKASEDSLTEFRAAGSFAMQADMKSALPHLLRVKPDELKPDRRDVASCMRTRFIDDKPEPVPGDLDKWTGNILTIYRRYWTHVMLGSISAEKGERELAAALAKKVRHSPEATDMGALEPLLQEQIEARGYHALFGITAPLREFMLWRKQADTTYDLDLPEGRQTVRVEMMDDFASLGWLGYATCDFLHSGGWATDDRLFAVRSAYDLESESFHVSYLAHEGQHFSDYHRFVGLEQPDLEYRAKLVEIADAKTTLFDLLASFESNGSDSRDTPHPWANRQVITHLAAKLLDGKASSADAWKQVPAEKINAAAKELLEEDSKRRLAAKGKN